MSQPRNAWPLALVTGGSSGIGRELARQFTLHGFDLVIGGSGDRVEDAAAALRLSGAAVVTIKSDLATYDGVEAVWKAVQDTGRPLAAAALNAGIGTALLPGATDTDFHQRAGMGDTKFGDNSWKNSRELVVRKGYEALMAGRDHVIGGDRATWRAAVMFKFLPERVKAHRQARQARPN